MKAKPAINGVININKPSGITSHDVVDRVRKVSRISQVGHTGTLDPMATGVLPLCIGRATKIQQFLIAEDKEYRVKMTLGIVTNSQDTTGTVTEEVPVPDCSTDDIEAVLDGFRGEQMQTPPMVSAKHHKGKRLYELARKGVEVEREPCRIFIHKLELVDVSMPVIEFDVHCSKGTYIRTLCHDIGKALNSGAAMSGLIRTRCGAFCIEESVDLDRLESADDVRQATRTMSDALSSLPQVMVSPTGKASLVCGRSLTGSDIARRNGEFDEGEFIRVSMRDGSLLGVGEALLASKQLDELAGNLKVLKPVKIFQNL